MLIISMGCSQSENGLSKAEMTFKQDLIYDFGKIKHFGNGTVEFEFKNTGKDPLVITNVKSSCGCTAALLSSKKLMPNEIGKLKIEFDTNNLFGQVARTVTLFSNDRKNPTRVLTLIVNIDKE